MTRIKDKCVLITGAGSGIGRIMGRLALERGARKVVIWDINEENIAASITAYGAPERTAGYRVDVSDPQQIAEISNEVQRYFVEQTRLGIPVALQTENLCGYPAAGGTLFPAQINVGATWEPELAGQMGVTDKAVSKWERDLSCPDVSSLPKLAEIFGVSVDELMQVKAAGAKMDGVEKRDSIAEILDLVLKGVALAMGVAVVVLSFTGLDATQAARMLGLGLACLAAGQLGRKK